jgi:acyl dehydratase
VDERRADLLHWEDFTEGSVWPLGSWTVTVEEIVAFATDWDPQYFHVDAEAAVDGPFGGLVASGWHTGSIWMRLYADAVLNRAAGMGGGGLDEIRWLVPTRPGDVLTGTLTVTAQRISSHRADRGTMMFESRLVNQDGGVAVQLSGRGYLARRSPA